MFKLSDTPSKAEYKDHDREMVFLGDLEVKIVNELVSTKSGSWERGFKFGAVTYGILQRTITKKSSWSKGKTYETHVFSADHGKSWHPDVKTAKKAKGKVIVERSTPSGEFAFNSIQALNRNYYGPDYKWKP